MNDGIAPIVLKPLALKSLSIIVWLTVPTVFALSYLNVYNGLVLFLLAAVALIPAANLLNKATEQVAANVGDAFGSFLLTTFANLPELIIALVAISAAEYQVAAASVIGSIIGKVVFVLGVAFLVGGIKSSDQDFNARGAMTMVASLVIATVAFIYPSLMYHTTKVEIPVPTIVSVSLWISIILFSLYVLSLIYSLKTHRNLFGGDASTPEAPAWSLAKSLAVMVVAAALTGYLASILVGEVEQVAESFHVSRLFIGLIIVAGLGNVSELSVAISAARNGRLSFVTGVTLGSAILIALFVIPIMIFASYFIGSQPLPLVFLPSELVSLFLVLFVVGFIVSDGKSTWFKGAQLLGLYAIIAISFYAIG